MLKELYDALDRFSPGGEKRPDIYYQYTKDRELIWKYGYKSFTISQYDHEIQDYPIEELQQKFMLLLKFTIQMMNNRLCPNIRFEQFVKQATFNTIELVVYITKYSMDDELYREMQSHFQYIIIFLNMMMTEEESEDLNTVCSEQEFIQLIRYLKMLDIMSRQKSFHHRVIGIISEQQLAKLTNTFIYKALIDTKYYSHSKKWIFQDLQRFNISLSQPIIWDSQPVNIDYLIMKTWETLQSLPISIGIKVTIYQDIKQTLKS